ncbi:MAG: hypothetical protein FRX49_07731 [Trebouxia sp. A1-2]|nr:MAG: hypothetical protein FRX49_07731 [Trebouxia sp. A1-2]
MSEGEEKGEEAKEEENLKRKKKQQQQEEEAEEKAREDLESSTNKDNEQNASSSTPISARDVEPMVFLPGSMISTIKRSLLAWPPNTVPLPSVGSPFPASSASDSSAAEGFCSADARAGSAAWDLLSDFGALAAFLT